MKTRHIIALGSLLSFSAPNLVGKSQENFSQVKEEKKISQSRKEWENKHTTLDIADTLNNTHDEYEKSLKTPIRKQLDELVSLPDNVGVIGETSTQKTSEGLQETYTIDLCFDATTKEKITLISYPNLGKIENIAEINMLLNKYGYIIKKSGDKLTMKKLSSEENTIYQNIFSEKNVKYIKYESGDLYFGPIKEGKFNGLGVIHLNTGESYFGEFVDGKFDGKGIFFLYSGDVHKGNRKNGKQEGKGEYIGSDGNKYEGNFVDGFFEGQGKLTLQDGTTYKGGFAQGVFEGTGTLDRANGDSYTGQWENGKESGIGTVIRKNGDTYTGERKNGNPNGNGTLTYNNIIYAGNFVDGFFEGQGTLTRPDGSFYSGNFVKGQFDGIGTLKNKYRDTYAGERKNGKREGQGTYIDSWGNIFVGTFLDDKMEGEGIFTDISSGEKFIQIRRANILISETPYIE